MRGDVITNSMITDRALADLITEIFLMRGELRDGLLEWISNDPATSTKRSDFLTRCIEKIKTATPTKKRGTLHYNLTPNQKFLQINVHIYRRYNKNTGSDFCEWCIVGKDLQEIFRFLPDVFDNGEYDHPVCGRHHSRWYPLYQHETILHQIAFELHMLDLYLSTNVNSVIKREKIHEHPSVQGTVDLDFYADYTPLRVFCELTGVDLLKYIKPFADNRCNPYKTSRGVFLYKRDGTQERVIDDLLHSIEMKDIYPQYIRMIDQKQFQDDLHRFKDSKKRFALMGLDGHTLFWIKCRDYWYLCDPLKNRFTPEPEIYTLFGSVFQTEKGVLCWDFLPRDYSEQSPSEGSCTIASLSRIVQCSIMCTINKTFDEQFDKMTLSELKRFITTPIESWSAMLALSLIRTHQKKVCFRIRKQNLFM